MKRIIILTIIMVMAAAPLAFGAGVTNGTLSTSSTLGFNASKLVAIAFNIDTVGPGATFAAGAKHTSGSRAFGIASNTSQIYYKEIAPATSIASGDVNNVDSSAFTSGWSQL